MSVLFGYYIDLPEGRGLFVEVLKKNVSYFNGKEYSQTISMRDTMFALLVFLLEHGNNITINNHTLLKSVWDQRGLRSSSQQLNRTLQSLIYKMYNLGVKDNIIVHIPRSGYKLNVPNISLLYLEGGGDV